MKVKVEDFEQLKSLELSSEPELLSQFLSLGLKIDHSCESSGTCGTCQFQCIGGEFWLQEPNEVEQLFWRERGQESQSVRLSCQSWIKTGSSEHEQPLLIKFHYSVFK